MSGWTRSNSRRPLQRLEDQLAHCTYSDYVCLVMNEPEDRRPRFQGPLAPLLGALAFACIAVWTGAIGDMLLFKIAAVGAVGSALGALMIYFGDKNT